MTPHRSRQPNMPVIGLRIRKKARETPVLGGGAIGDRPTNELRGEQERRIAK